jgi:hypothetical protein
MHHTQDPLLSVVVVIVSDTTDARADVSHLARCLEALAGQVEPPPVEVLVPYHPAVEGIEELQTRFPEVVFFQADGLKTYTGVGGSREHHDELRARGLAAARGPIIGLLEDHARPDPRWCARVVAAHQQPYAAVGGAIENGINRPLNWAVYFCDFGKYQNPVPAGESPFASDANISYKRSALEAIRPVWQEIFHETAVNWALTSRGQKLALSPEIIVHQHRSDLRLLSALKERYVWGRSYAATRAKFLGSKRLVYAALAPLLPAILLLRMGVTSLKKRRCFFAFLKALPWIALLTACWSWGELVGYATGRADASGTPAGEALASAGVGSP